MTLFINLLAVLQSLTTMYKENDYVPNSTILGVSLFFLVLFYNGPPFGLLFDYKTFSYREPLSCTEQLSQCGAQTSTVHVLHFQCPLSRSLYLSLSLFLSLPQCHCFLDI